MGKFWKGGCEAPFKLRGLGAYGLRQPLVIREEADPAGEMVRVFKSENAIDAHVVTSKKEQVNYWESRDNILNILQASDGGEKLIMVGAVEASVPLSHLGDALDHMIKGHNYSALKEAKLFVYGHIGTCDLHGMWVAPPSISPEKKVQIAREAIKLEGDINLMWGCASGEIGQTASRMPFFKKRYGEAAHRMLQNVKKAIDPNNILNPGNLEGEGYEHI
jgi:glycolate oxidase